MYCAFHLGQRDQSARCQRRSSRLVASKPAHVRRGAVNKREAGGVTESSEEERERHINVEGVYAN